MIAVQPKPETRTAAEVEAFAAHMDFLRRQYRKDRAAGLEGVLSVPADDVMAWDPFAEIQFMERLLRGTCNLPHHAMYPKHAAAH